MLNMLWEKEICKWHHELNSHSFLLLALYIQGSHLIFFTSKQKRKTKWRLLSTFWLTDLNWSTQGMFRWQDDILSGGVLTLLDPGPEPGPDSLLAGPWPYPGGGAWSPAQRTHEAQDVTSLRRRWLESCQTHDQSSGGVGERNLAPIKS